MQQVDEAGAGALARLVNERVEELGLSNQDVADRSGGLVSDETVRKIRNSEAGKVQVRSLRGLKVALDLTDLQLEEASGGGFLLVEIKRQLPALGVHEQEQLLEQINGWIRMQRNERAQRMPAEDDAKSD